MTSDCHKNDGQKSATGLASSMRNAAPGRGQWWFYGMGVASLVWYLIRVVPKPSRAVHPCQQVAASWAGQFLVGMVGALTWKRLRHPLAFGGVVILVMLMVGTWVFHPLAMAETNHPLGVGKGIFPGRVVWVHDPAATHWAGPGDGHWWEDSHTNQAAVDRMMSAAVQGLAGTSIDQEVWEAFFRHFNRTHGRGDIGYRRGEKIAIKVNFVGFMHSGSSVDPKTYNLAGKRVDYMNTSPQVILALLRQLVNAAGVAPEDISVGDPMARFPNQFHDVLQREFPDVLFVDHDGGVEGHPRTRVVASHVPLYWSSRPRNVAQDFIPVHFAEATYLINVANLKSHRMAGVTLGAKNHFGSLIRKPTAAGYLDMHRSTAGETPGWGHYRVLVDLLGHADLGAKTLITFIDGLYPGRHPVDDAPQRWYTAPFNGDWASSLFASQDPVAIDSVGIDFLQAEWTDYPHMPGVDDYLQEAALAHDPPSGTFYDPNHPTAVTRLDSLGVHEHWNSAKDRQYSRNLGKPEGIELIQVLQPQD